MDEEKITIIEGPPPIFEPVQDAWAMGQNEGPHALITLLTRLRTFNGAELVERCYRSWRQQKPIHLHYRNEIGLEEKAPIQAARSVETEEGQVLLLWVYFNQEKIEFEYDRGEDNAEDDREG